MTDMQLVRTAVSGGGVGAELFWFHDEGYFEEFLGHKSGMQSLQSAGIKQHLNVCF